MKIKITKKCKLYECWYNNLIGREFEVKTEPNPIGIVFVKTNFNNGYGRIFSGDYEIVKEQE